jgi:hypothetical protein
MRKRRGFNWIPEWLKARDEAGIYAWPRDSRLATWARAGKNSKKRDARRTRHQGKRHTRNYEE